MEKYLLIDTNIFIYCSLFSEEKEDDKLFESLLSILDGGKAYILLPEVIELEYKRKLRIELKKIKNALSETKNVIGEKISSTQIRKEIKNAVDKAGEDRETKIDAVEKTVEKIFKHKNTVRIPLEANIFLAAYKRALQGLKPYKHTLDVNAHVQPDCLIIESAKKILETKGDYELYICGNDQKDYAIADQNGIKLHPDIAREFKKVKYYSQLHKLLIREFGAKIEEEKLTITKAEKEPQGSTTISSVGTETFSVSRNTVLEPYLGLGLREKPYLADTGIFSPSVIGTGAYEGYGVQSTTVPGLFKIPGTDLIQMREVSFNVPMDSVFKTSAASDNFKPKTISEEDICTKCKKPYSQHSKTSGKYECPR